MKYMVFYIDDKTDGSANTVVEADSEKEAAKTVQKMPSVYRVVDVQKIDW